MEVPSRLRVVRLNEGSLIYWFGSCIRFPAYSDLVALCRGLAAQKHRIKFLGSYDACS